MLKEDTGGPTPAKLDPPQPKQVRVPLPFKGQFRLTQAFGENPHIYRRLGLPGHNGLDWGMPEGEEILAVDDGFVIRVEERPEGFGKHVKVQHTWGQSLYAHLSEFKVVLNQPVEQGQVIGLSGNTGFSTGPHLHFGMRVKPYDKGDGWYGYTNPHRYLIWPDAGPIATGSLATAEDLEALAFQLQEMTMALDLWEERIMALLQRYLPGEVPEDADLMVLLENLLASWNEELEKLRGETIAGLFGPG
ncbi:MAG TPA: M23 family metallopeptidase [Anaerolineae bacterium]|nr:M23 family metallopeptidase [Anaerolineae bacterium]